MNEGRVSDSPELREKAVAVNSRIDVIRELNFLRDKTKHVLSRSLPENILRDKDVTTYERILSQYEKPIFRAWSFEDKHPNEKRQDFISPADVNIGWKVHLNVSPQSAKFVSDYLIQQGYDHKFLTRGSIPNGKIFTIYIGSYFLTSKLANQISHDLQGYLSRPTNDSEIEFAEGVVGRFSGVNGKYDQYGSSGITWLAEDIEKNEQELNKKKDLYSGQDGRKRELIIHSMEERAFKALKDDYGDYFLPSRE